MHARLIRIALTLASIFALVSAASAQLQPAPAYPPPAAQPAPTPTPAPAPAPAYQQPQYQPEYQPAPAPAPSYAPPPAPAPEPAPAPAPEAAPEPEAEPTGSASNVSIESDNSNWQAPSDHDRVNGRVAIGWLGLLTVPIGPAGSDTTMDAPTVGVRYWINDTLGIQGGLGVGLSSTGGTFFMPTTGGAAGADMDIPAVNTFAMAIHAGLPISVFDAGHYNGILLPEVNVGFSSGLDEGGSVMSSADDTIYSGFLLGLGLRAGAEIHLEFLDIPQSSIQVTFGLAVNLETRSDENDPGTAGATTGEFSLQTSVLDLDSLVEGIQVFFYF